MGAQEYLFLGKICVTDGDAQLMATLPNTLYEMPLCSVYNVIRLHLGHAIVHRVIREHTFSTNVFLGGA